MLCSDSKNTSPLTAAHTTPLGTLIISSPHVSCAWLRCWLAQLQLAGQTCNVHHTCTVLDPCNAELPICTRLCIICNGSGSRPRSLQNLEESVYYHSAVPEQLQVDCNPNCMLDDILDHARTGSILIMTTEGVVKAAGFQRMNEENRWNALRDVIETGAEATEAVQAPRPHITYLPLTPRRRYITRADLRKYCVTIGCSACSDIAVHGKTSKPNTEECRNRIGEQMEHNTEGHERLQAHKRRRTNRASVARENEGELAPQE